MIHIGVPECIRGRLWIKLLEIEQAKSVHSDGLYAKLCDFDNEEASAQIDKDIDRTLADLNFCQENQESGENRLFNILVAYANYDNEVGYVQGMNFIVALLLFYLPDQEENVFWGLHQLMQRRNWRLVYTHNFPKLKSITKLLENRIQ
mmetsp:Transcript_30001/g.39860  ORF Transcript_30001/g.39860 Transcript_30001/m.39860 type:complete len:148 (+) Transcript_30001:152-595(+)